MLRDQPGSNTLVSFLLGGLTGASLAVLFAPRAGNQTRQDLLLLSRAWAHRGRHARASLGGRSAIRDTPLRSGEASSAGDPARVPEPAVAAPPQNAPGLV